jgi:hypothetical protein
MIRIVCSKWTPRGPKRGRVPYTAEHVNRLANAIDRHLKMPHEIVCITDDPVGIDGGVRIVPIWDDGLLEKGSCYVRLKLFAPEMADIIGPRFVSIDLDAVITGPLDPLFDGGEDFRIWRNVGRGCLYCGSMFLMDAGARAQVWETFNPDDLIFREAGRKFKRKLEADRWVHPEAIAAGNAVGSDQAWIATVLGPGEAVWTAADGVLSLKADVMANGPKLRSRAALPAHSRIVFFHGAEDPSQERVQHNHTWIQQHWC